MGVGQAGLAVIDIAESGERVFACVAAGGGQFEDKSEHLSFLIFYQNFQTQLL